MRTILAALAAIVVVAFVAWAGTTHFTNLQAEDITATDDLVVTDDASVGGNLAVTGTITGFSGENVTVAATLDSTCIVGGTFKALTATYLSKAVVCSSTVAVTGAITATGGVVGALTTTATIFQSVAYKGNLPTAGDNKYEFFRNTAGDTGWVSDVDSWVQLWP